MTCELCHDEGELAQIGDVLLAPCSVVSTRVRELLAMDTLRLLKTIARAAASRVSHMNWARAALRDGMRRVRCECQRYTVTHGEPVREEVVT